MKYIKLYENYQSFDIIAYHGTRAYIPFENFKSEMIGSGLVSLSYANKNYDGFFFTSEIENAEFYTEYFIIKVKINNVSKNPYDTKHPPTVLKKAKNDDKIYIIEDYLDGLINSDITVVPDNKSNNVKISEWIFIGEETYLFNKYDEFFGYNEEDNLFVNKDIIEDVLYNINMDINYLLKIPIFKKYYDSKG